MTHHVFQPANPQRAKGNHAVDKPRNPVVTEYQSMVSQIQHHLSRISLEIDAETMITHWYCNARLSKTTNVYLNVMKDEKVVPISHENLWRDKINYIIVEHFQPVHQSLN